MRAEYVRECGIPLVVRRWAISALIVLIISHRRNSKKMKDYVVSGSYVAIKL